MEILSASAGGSLLIMQLVIFPASIKNPAMAVKLFNRSFPALYSFPAGPVTGGVNVEFRLQFSGRQGFGFKKTLFSLYFLQPDSSIAAVLLSPLQSSGMLRRHDCTDLHLKTGFWGAEEL